jgi:hypothetical protein
MLVLKHQYPREWQASGDDAADDTTGNAFETTLLKERQSLEEIAVAFYSRAERRSFRFE